MSTDKQSADSPADQIARCREFAAGRGWQVVESLVVSEAGVSGASRHNRPGLLDLVARIREWDVLLCWDLSRLARDSEDLGWVRNRLRAHRRTGYEVSTGLDLFNVGAKVLGVMAEEYLVKLRADTQRGLRGRAERGLSTGGTPYGYRTEPVEVGEHGRAVDGAGYQLTVEEAQAAVVRRIFDLYLAGAGLREIAHRLNAEAVPPPRPRSMKSRGASWAPSSVRAMLRNPIYKGERIFNRSEWVKDHETGRRRRFERPEADWVREERPDLAIVSSAEFERVQTDMRRRAATAPYLRKANRFAGNRPGRGGRGPARHILSGFLECGECGGAFHTQTATRYGCGWHRGRGPVVCSNDLLVPRGALEERIFGAIRNQILVPDVVAYAVEKTIEYVEADLREEPSDSSLAARLAEIEEELKTLGRAAARVGLTAQVAQLVAALEAERVSLLTPTPTAPVGFDPETWRPWIEARVLEMRSAFEGGPEERRTAFRALLGDRRMRVFRDNERLFRVEGLFELTLEATDARASDRGHRASALCGSGGALRNSRGATARAAASAGGMKV
jgi:DNA invertase Pin-like site-specific DNA recombinase